MIEKTEGKRSSAVKLLGFGTGLSSLRSLQAKVGEKPNGNGNGGKKDPPDDFFDTPPDDENGNGNGTTPS